MSAPEGFEAFDRFVTPLKCDRCGAVVEKEDAKAHMEWHDRLNKAVERASSGIVGMMFAEERGKL